MLSLVWILYVVPSLLVNIPFVQKEIATTATQELSRRLGVPVQIERVDIEWFNRLVLEGLYLEDQQGKVMFKANHVAAGFDILPLLDGKLTFNTVRLFGPHIHLSRKTATDPLNLKFVIDAFASKDTTPKKKLDIDLRFNTVLIRQGHFSYDVEDVPQTPDKFNAKHIDIRDLSAKISLKALRKDSIHAQIKKLSLKEGSGFSLDKLTLSVVGNSDSIYVKDFKIALPQTDLRISEAKVDLTEIDSTASNFVDKAKLSLRIAPSHVRLRDLSAFVPAFRNFTDSIEIYAQAAGHVNHFSLKNLTLRYGKKMLLVGKMDLKGITHPQEAYVYGQVSKMYITTVGLSDLLNNFSKDRVVLPAPFVKLGTINFTGEISGFFDNLVAYGRLSTAVGSLQTDLIFGNDKAKNVAAFLKGRVQTNELNLEELLGEQSQLGKAKCGIRIDAKRPVGGHFAGEIQANVERLDYKNYTYQDIRLAGSFRRNAFDGSLQVEDPNISLLVNGLLESKKENTVVNLAVDLAHFRPDKLHLSDKYEEPDISLSLNADFTGNNIDNVVGTIEVDDLSFKTKPDSFALKKLLVKAGSENGLRQLKISSDIVNGEVNGAYSFGTIVPSFMNTLKGYIPTLINTRTLSKKVDENDFTMLLTIENTEALSHTLKLPVTMLQPARIAGSYNNAYNKFRFEAYLPQFQLGNSSFEGGYLHCSNPTDKMDLSLKATQYNAKGTRNYLDLHLDAKEDCVNTYVKWNNNKEHRFGADVSATTCFFMEEPDPEDKEAKPVLRTEIALHETPLIVNDTVWYIRPSSVTLRNGKIDVNNFVVERGKEFVHLNGMVSKEVTDSLKMDLNNFELGYIFDILNIESVKFTGKATGKFNICDLYGSRMLNTDLEVQDFSFNGVKLGRLNLFSEWDDSQRGILMLGSIYKNDSTWSDVSGYIYPVRTPEREPGLSLHFDANDMNIAFLQPFMEKIVQNVKGSGFGKIHLFGPFKELNVVGDAYVADGGMGIEFLNTYYTFSDSIHLDTTSIQIRNLAFHDKFNHTGHVDLRVNHAHFKNFDYHVNIQADNMLMYDVPEKQNPLIYGVVYGTGTAAINGNGQVTNFDINMQSRPNTHVYLNFMGNSTASEYDFITFVDKKKLREEALLREEAVRDSIAGQLFADDESSDLRMNFLLDITPDANIELIIDPNAGDRIKGYGSGSMQIQYGTRSDVRIYGNFGIESGNYNFSLQQLIHKDFKIREGSMISFNGDPFNANLDINAIYNVTANLSDLDQSLALESARTNVPVNCVLQLSGMLRQPSISFDLELPGSNEELERQMKSLIDTDDMMTRQIVYLLVLNKFYTPEYTGTQGSNNFTAVASSALSSQISSLLNNITDKVQIGTNIRASEDGITDTEFEMLLSSQLLNNRLLFNGNFGYKNNPTQKNAIIGEFDLEYKLTRSGEIRLKAYNHANDMYQYLKQALTTQGVGIMFKKDFTHFSELFQRRRRLFPLPMPADTVPAPLAPKDSVR